MTAMTEEERELLKQTALAVGAIGRALRDGYGIHDLELLYQDILRNVAGAYEKAYPKPVSATGDDK